MRRLLRRPMLLPLLLAALHALPARALDDATPQLTLVKNDPRSIPAWLALIQIVRSDDSPYLRWITSRALQLNPNHPDILLAAGRAAPWHDPAFSAKQFAELARISGFEQLSADSLEWLFLGLPIDQPSSSPRDAQWATRLITLRNLDRTATVLAAALARDPQNKTLLALDAFQLALNNKFDEARARQRSAGFPQLPVGPFLGLADVLLLADQPAAAVESYGTLAPATPESRRLLAWALQRSRAPDRARALLADQTNHEDLLLRFIVETDNNNPAGARALAEQLVKPFLSQPQGQSPAPAGIGDAIALRPPLNRALKALPVLLPDKKSAIEYYLGITVPDPYLSWHPIEPDPPPAEALRRANELLTRATSPEEKRNAHFSLSHAHQLAGDDDRALAAIATAVFSDDLWPNDKPRQRNAQIQWTLLLRRIEGDRLFRAKPDELLAALPSYAALRIFPGSGEDQHRKMSHADTVKNFSAFGPGILALLYPTFGINTIGPQRADYLQIISNVGSPADLPILCDTLRILGRAAKEYADLPANHVNKGNEAQNLTEFQLLNACLTSITHQSPPDNTIDATIAFWQKTLDQLAPTLAKITPTAAR